MRELFSDRLTIIALALVLITAGLVLFVSFSYIPIGKPIIGIVVYSSLFLLFIASGVVFLIAMRSEGRGGSK